MINDNFLRYDQMVEDIASLAHEKFRKIYLQDNNGKRIKTTKDKDWAKQHGTDQSDLANLSYDELPSDWQNERRQGAKVALDAASEAVKNNKPLDEEFIEHASDLIHEDWLSRNMARAEDKHRYSYGQLSEDAKEKDRIFARSAIEVLERNN
jgi:hypothetical protein